MTHTVKRIFFVTGLTLILGTMLAGCGGEGGEVGGESSEGGSTHNPGSDCVSCHGQFRYAGTIYTSAGATSLAPGQKITITQNDGTVIQLVSDQNGNFYTTKGNPAVGYGAAVEGNKINMLRQPTTGACSAAACHDGTTWPRIYRN